MLPRLVYFGEVPVESGFHGSALLFRLLDGWPPQQLLILELHSKAIPARRLPNVAYKQIDFAIPTHRRFGTAFLFFQLKKYVDALERSLANFRPECVLTVAHSAEWLPAYLLARRLGVPLHLIVHDDSKCREFTNRSWLLWINDTIFGHVYRAARSRLCVSPYMEEDYRVRYGVSGTVLLPSVGSRCPQFAFPASRPRDNRASIRIAFGGMLQDSGPALILLAECLMKVGGELLIYGSSSEDRTALACEASQVMMFMPFMHEAAYVQSLYENADAAYLPMSFSPASAEKMRLCFPSKLTAYTAAGLPVIARGPVYCSAVRWARENAGFSVVVTDPSPNALDSAILSILQDDNLRLQLAHRSMDIGRKFFRDDVAKGIFVESVTKGGA